MAHLHPKTKAGKGKDNLDRLRTHLHKTLAYSFLLREAAERIHDAHYQLYQLMLRGEHVHVMKSINPDLTRAVAGNLKVALNLAEETEFEARLNDKNMNDIHPATRDQRPAENQLAKSETDSSSSDEEEGVADDLPPPP